MVPGSELPGRCLAMVPVPPPCRGATPRWGDGGAAAAGLAAATHDAAGGRLGWVEKHGEFDGDFMDLCWIARVALDS